MDNPTNGELKIMLDNQKEKGDYRHEELMRLLREVRDDGKVNKDQIQKTADAVMLHDQILKSYPEQMKSLTDVVFWKKYVLIAMGMLWTALLIGVPLLIRYFNRQIHNTVVDTFSQFDIVVK